MATRYELFVGPEITLVGTPYLLMAVVEYTDSKFLFVESYIMIRTPSDEMTLQKPRRISNNVTQAENEVPQKPPTEGELFNELFQTAMADIADLQSDEYKKTKNQKTMAQSIIKKAADPDKEIRLLWRHNVGQDVIRTIKDDTKCEMLAEMLGKLAGLAKTTDPPVSDPPPIEPWKPYSWKG